MGYKWKPNKSQREAFKTRMADPKEKEAYELAKEQKMANKRSKSKFDYKTAGGFYVPTKEQYEFVMQNMDLFKTDEEITAANIVVGGFSCNEKVNHDFIHIVNEKRRTVCLNL